MGVWLKFREMLPGGWIEVRYEDTVGALASQARRILDFLELPWNPDVLGYRERLQSRPVNSPTYEAVSQPLYTRSIGRWRQYAKHFEPHLERLQPLVEAFGYNQADST
jgi:hypothetical protein